MKNGFVTWLCSLCFSLFIVNCPLLYAKPPIVKETAPLVIEVPKFAVKTLSCGMKVLFLKDDELPLVSVNLLIPGGQVQDPEGKEGLANLMCPLLRDGGAGKFTAEGFDQELEGRAASMDAAAEKENFSANFKCLAGDLPRVLELFADMVRRPAFDLKRFETAKTNSLDSLNRLTDTPDNLTRALFSRVLMGHSPYGHLATPKILTALTRDDVSRFYAENFGPRGAVLAVTGKFDEDQVASQLEGLFSGWKNQSEVPARPDAQPLGPAIYFYPKDVSQVFIRWGVPGLKRHDPKDIPLQVANYTLGGSGFSSRLMGQIRSNRGLAYFVDSFSIPYDVRGVFESVGGTRPDAVGEYLKLMFGVMEEFAKEGPTDKELDEAKRSMIEEFAYNFESSYKLAPYKASLDFHGYPADYLEKYRASVKAVTREQATRAAQAILSQKDWVLVVCGPASLEKDLSAFGKVVKVISLFEPLGNRP